MTIERHAAASKTTQASTRIDARSAAGKTSATAAAGSGFGAGLLSLLAADDSSVFEEASVQTARPDNLTPGRDQDTGASELTTPTSATPQPTAGELAAAAWLAAAWTPTVSPVAVAAAALPAAAGSGALSATGSTAMTVTTALPVGLVSAVRLNSAAPTAALAQPQTGAGSGATARDGQALPVPLGGTTAPTGTIAAATSVRATTPATAVATTPAATTAALATTPTATTAALATTPAAATVTLATTPAATTEALATTPAAATAALATAPTATTAALATTPATAAASAVSLQSLAPTPTREVSTGTSPVANTLDRWPLASAREAAPSEPVQATAAVATAVSTRAPGGEATTVPTDLLSTRPSTSSASATRDWRRSATASTFSLGGITDAAPAGNVRVLDATVRETLRTALEDPAVALAIAVDLPGSPQRQQRFDSDEAGHTTPDAVADGLTGLSLATGSANVAAAAAPAAGDTPFGRSLAEQVSYWLDNQVQNAELQLDAFGGDPVQVSIAINGNEAQVVFRSDQAETRQALGAALSELEQALLSQGLVLAGASVGASGGDAAGARRDSAQPARTAEVAATPVAAVAGAAPVPMRASGRALDVFV